MSKCLQSLTQKLSLNALSNLRRYGYCIIDNAVSDEMANNLLSEIKPLQEFEVMYPCHTHININNETRLIPKRNVWELELHSYPELKSICSDLWTILNDKSLPNALNGKESMYHYTHQTLKILYSENNGCFPIHFDSDSSIDLRRITAILYLNEQQIDGGQLRLYPLLSSPVDIAPKYNRLVLFSSCFMLHRTLKCMQPRYALNFWFHIEQNAENEMKGEDESADLYQCVLGSKYIKCLTKLLYNDEWKESIIEAHKEQSDIEWLLNTHQNDIELSQKILSSKFENIYQDIERKGSVDVNDRYLSEDCWQKCQVDWLC